MSSRRAQKISIQELHSEDRYEQPKPFFIPLRTYEEPLNGKELYSRNPIPQGSMPISAQFPQYWTDLVYRVYFLTHLLAPLIADRDRVHLDMYEYEFGGISYTVSMALEHLRDHEKWFGITLSDPRQGMSIKFHSTTIDAMLRGCMPSNTFIDYINHLPVALFVTHIMEEDYDRSFPLISTKSVAELEAEKKKTQAVPPKSWAKNSARQSSISTQPVKPSELTCIEAFINHFVASKSSKALADSPNVTIVKRRPKPIEQLVA